MTEIFGLVLQNNVGDNVKDPKFVRTLMTAILETSIGKEKKEINYLKLSKMK